MKPLLSPIRSQTALSQQTAEQILQNVFAACNREMNSVPLEALTSYSNYRKERYALQRSLILLMIALFLLLPFLFWAARIHITQVNSGSSRNPVYAISVSAHLPIRQVEANLNGQTVPLYEVAPGSYTAVPRSNGDMQVTATLINRQQTAAFVHVESVDTAAPVLLSTEIGENSILFFLSDEGSGVDYDAVTVAGEDSSSIKPLHFDPLSGCIALPYPACTLHVRIPDLCGNVLRIDLKPQE